MTDTLTPRPPPGLPPQPAPPQPAPPQPAPPYDAPAAAGTTLAHRPGRWIDGWDPEDGRLWTATGRRTAHRNLAWSILGENLGFSVWMLWSIVVVSLPAAGFDFSADRLFWLVAVPNLVGALMRLPYTFAVPRFGGRNWTVVSVTLLLVPVTLLGVAVTDPRTPYWFFLLAAATAGLGGGNFASSMANISFFYPERRKGLALGLNAAGGNLGVAVVQLGVPLLLGVGAVAVLGGAQGEGLYLQNAALVWVPLIGLAALGAWLFMDNLSSATADLTSQLVVARRPHTWVVATLYIGTFGSFIGYSAAMPLLISTQYPGVAVGSYAFLGALVGSLARPVGGWLADRFGGARITAASFAVMAAGATCVWWTVEAQAPFALFLASFVLLFLTTGIGNGSTFTMIPVIFRTAALRRQPDSSDAARELAASAGRREAAALGIASAVGALGGFLIPRGFGSSLASTGSVASALGVFVGFYLCCLALTWWCYLRRNTPATSRRRLCNDRPAR